MQSTKLKRPYILLLSQISLYAAASCCISLPLPEFVGNWVRPVLSVWIISLQPVQFGGVFSKLPQEGWDGRLLPQKSALIQSLSPSVAACKTEPSQMASPHVSWSEASIFSCVEGMPTGKKAAAPNLRRVRFCGEPCMEKWEGASNTGGERHDRKIRVEFGRRAKYSRAGYWVPAQKGKTERCHPR